MKKFISAVKKYNMLEKGDKVIVGVSGGADSVALLLLLNELSKEFCLTLFAVHVNHGIRKDEAQRDENFVKDLCQHIGIQFESVRGDVPLIAKTLSMSEEEAGRHLRYETFYSYFKSFNADKIAVAHNLNDRAETLIMRLCRGTGLTGLRGIPPVRDVIIRPLIDCTREEIEQWLKNKNQEFCTDSSNLSDGYTRNKIRLNVIPYLEKEINKGAIANIVKTSVIVSQEDDFVEEEAKKLYDKSLAKTAGNALYFKIKELECGHEVLQRRVIRQGFRSLNKEIKDLTMQHINSVMDIIKGETGKRVDVGGGLWAQREYDFLKLYKTGEEKDGDFCYSLQKDAAVFIEEKGVYVEISENKKKIGANSHNVYTKAFDCDKINVALVARNRKPGDVFYINSRGQSKKLKDFFIDEKIPRDTRNKMLLIADENRILWLVGHKAASFFEAQKNTKRLLYIHVWEEKVND